MYRYNERSDDPVVGSLYIRKTAFPKGRPDEVIVSIEPGKVQ